MTLHAPPHAGPAIHASHRRAPAGPLTAASAAPPPQSEDPEKETVPSTLSPAYRANPEKIRPPINGRVGERATLACDPLSPRRTGQADFPASGSPENVSPQACAGSCTAASLIDAPAQIAGVAHRS